MRLLSDTKLTDDGFKIWEKLSTKYTIHILDKNVKPHKTFTLDSIPDMKKYLGKGVAFRNWIYFIEK